MGRPLTDIFRTDTDVWAALVEVVLVALVLIPGSGTWSGPVLLTLTATHGVHLFDLVVVAMWTLVLAAAARRGVVRELAAPLTPAGRPMEPAVTLG